MKKHIEYWKTKPSTYLVFIIFLFSLLFNYWSSSALNQSYENSGFPVPYHEAQLSFSPSKLKGWYSHLVENNNIEKYISTQNFDFVFILSIVVLHFIALIFVSRLFKEKSTGRKLLIFSAFISLLAPLFDALENLVSYLMLANPMGFSNYLAYVYSTLAAMKFGFFTFAYIAFAVGILTAMIKYVKNRISTKP